MDGRTEGPWNETKHYELDPVSLEYTERECKLEARAAFQ